jgi:hypothetical protein
MFFSYYPQFTLFAVIHDLLHFWKNGGTHGAILLVGEGCNARQPVLIHARGHGLSWV